MKRRRSSSPIALHQAFDELRFGRDGTLNLRDSLPSAADAVARAESWLRQRQIARGGEVLIITGRGASSPGGVGVVRDAVLRLLHSLRRRGVVEAVAEHTAGSFVVTLAPVKSLREAAPRRREQHPLSPDRPIAALDGLDADTRALLRRLAEVALAELGVRDADAFVEREMLVQLSRLTPSLRGSGDRERELRDAIRVAIEEHEGG